MSLIGAVAATAEPVQAVVGGTVVDDTTFATEWSFVVGVGRGADGGPWCTGSLVDADTVVTAAHCVTPLAPDTVWYGSAHLSSAGQVSIASIDSNPRYDENDISSGGDSAIVHLTGPITGVTPIRVVTRAEDAALASPVPVRFAGFGVTDVGPTSSLHQATSTASKQADPRFWIVDGVPNVCSGDSGGPLVTLLSGEPVLVGAASFVGGSCGLTANWTNLGVDSFIQDTFHPAPPPPPSESVLAYTIVPTSGVAPLTVAFDMTGSGYLDGRPTTFFIDPGTDTASGVTSDEPVVTSFTYTVPGTYEALLGFTDGTGGRAEHVSIQVNPPLPTAVLTYTATPTSGEAPLTVEIDLSGSGMSDGSAATYFIDPVYVENEFDGEVRDVPFATTFTYTEPGTYLALVGLGDATGEAFAIEMITITVTEPAPSPPFEPPVDSDVANQARAGQMIPFRFTVTDDGEPVTGLVEVTVTSIAYECPTQSSTDAIESYATSQADSLIELGDGRYQYNWKTPKAWAGSCRTLTIDVGDGPRSADFQFGR